MSHMPMTWRLLITEIGRMGEKEERRGRSDKEGCVWQVLKLYYAKLALGLTQTSPNLFKFMLGLSLHELGKVFMRLYIYRLPFYTSFYIKSLLYTSFYIESTF